MRSVEEIYAQMRADMEERCGFQPEDSCDLAVRLYAAAAQIQALAVSYTHLTLPTSNEV